MPPTPSSPSSPPRRSARIPTFGLYGEPAASTTPRAVSVHAWPADLLHVEPVAARALRYEGQIQPHAHLEFGQVVWLLRGTVRVRLDETSLEVTGPVAVLVPPGVVHAFEAWAPVGVFDLDCGQVLTLRHAVWHDLALPGAGPVLAALFEAPRVLHWPQPAPEVALIDGLFRQLAAEFAAQPCDAAGSPLPLWLAQAVLWRLAAALPRETVAAQGLALAGRPVVFQRFLALVEAHYLAHWPVSRYASVLGISPERLNRLVKAETGAGAQDVLHRRLVREACRRLVFAPTSVQRLADALGFEDPSYFSRFFRRLTGLSPRQWQRAQAPASRLPAR